MYRVHLMVAVAFAAINCNHSQLTSVNSVRQHNVMLRVCWMNCQRRPSTTSWTCQYVTCRRRAYHRAEVYTVDVTVQTGEHVLQQWRFTVSTEARWSQSLVEEVWTRSIWDNGLSANHEPKHDVKDTGDAGSSTSTALYDVDRQLEWTSVCLLMQTLGWDCTAQGC